MCIYLWQQVVWYLTYMSYCLCIVLHVNIYWVYQSWCPALCEASEQSIILLYVHYCRYDDKDYNDKVLIRTRRWCCVAMPLTLSSLEEGRFLWLRKDASHGSINTPSCLDTLRQWGRTIWSLSFVPTSLHLGRRVYWVSYCCDCNMRDHDVVFLDVVFLVKKERRFPRKRERRFPRKRDSFLQALVLVSSPCDKDSPSVTDSWRWFVLRRIFYIYVWMDICQTHLP